MMSKTARALGAAVMMLAAACADPTLVATPGTSNAALFDAVWSQTDLQYSMFALKHVDWDSVGRVMRPRALAATSDAELARLLGNMLETLRDRHVSLSTSVNATPIAYRTASDSQPSGFNATLIDHVYLTPATSHSTEHLSYGLAGPGVGYVRIPSFTGSGWANELDEALTALNDPAHLIIDVRDNLGGDDELAIALAGRFADRRRVYGYVPVRNGPSHDDFTPEIEQAVQPAGRHANSAVVVLTNRHVYSSAEDFVLALRELPNVTIVGDTTGGSSGKPITRELANGWTFTVSTWIEYDLERRPIEDAGVAPAIVVRAQPSDVSRGVDRAMNRALEMAGAAP